jgi:hypothetical protein
MPCQEQQTMQFTILFSPTARVYNLRFLLVATFATLVYWVLQLAWHSRDLRFKLRLHEFGIPLGVMIILGIVSCAVIILHQVLGYV